jgi:hypothetical protein
MEALKKGVHPRVGRDTDEAGADEDNEDEDEQTGIDSATQALSCSQQAAA